MMSNVPVIDLSGDPAAVGAEIDVVSREVGFFQVVGHGVSSEVVDAAWQAAAGFFDLPLEHRMSVYRPYAGYPYGYVPVGGETLSRSVGAAGAIGSRHGRRGNAAASVAGGPADGFRASPRFVAAGSAPDLKEVYNVGPMRGLDREPIDDGEATMFAANLWPPAMPELRARFSAYFDEMLALGERLTRFFAIALDLPEDFFASSFDRTPSSMRAISYPEQQSLPAPGQLRAGAHTDYGTFTILCQEDAPGGLEVKNPCGDAWLSVPSIPDAFVINIGDMLARWTNDRWRSTMHRVANPPPHGGVSSRRQSIAFFYNANYDSRVECIPTCVSADDPPRYEPVLAGPYLMSKFLNTVETG